MLEQKQANSPKPFYLKTEFPAGLVVRIPHFQLQGAWVQTLVRELRFHMPCGVTKKIFFFLKRNECQQETIKISIPIAISLLTESPEVWEALSQELGKRDDNRDLLVQYPCCSVTQSCPTLCNPNALSNLKTIFFLII